MPMAATSGSAPSPRSRSKSRDGSDVDMPPVGSEVVDTNGTAIVDASINSVP